MLATLNVDRRFIKRCTNSINQVEVVSVTDDTAVIAFFPPDDGGAEIIGCIYSRPIFEFTFICSFYHLYFHLICSLDYVYLLTTLPNFNTTVTYFRFGFTDMTYGPDGRLRLSVPVTTYAFNAFSVSAINLGELTSDPSNFTDDVFGAYPALLKQISPLSNTILGKYLHRIIHFLSKHNDRFGSIF